MSCLSLFKQIWTISKLELKGIFSYQRFITVKYLIKKGHPESESLTNFFTKIVNMCVEHHADMLRSWFDRYEFLLSQNRWNIRLADSGHETWKLMADPSALMVPFLEFATFQSNKLRINEMKSKIPINIYQLIHNTHEINKPLELTKVMNYAKIDRLQKTDKNHNN